MKSTLMLELADADAAIEAAIAKAAEKGWAVTVAVVDAGGHVLALRRMDGCAPVASYIAPEKARTAALGQRGSGAYEKMINDGRTAFLCVDVLKGTLEGGVPVVIDGQMVGAVGVSGVKPQEDLEVAEAGVAALAARA
ncbi:MAG: heme-binding protein [Lautropia sp.]|nr:heme-binding protein [Lautropia sp.]